ncbi:hypothetical protein TUM4438_31140 [Shewanella sairae]|uniref:OmpA-like domain-containing protein n=1 Tax=Shewanella sairae TaxID=190310 RepID=A0ABQ4PLC6_9GAMM|nr:OmpA family protein [Shewanella sairae]MCL1131884.1 OmpA family protein [Shewanella sairae]GIU48845.1 hypothetical protein TUM4438_31140 [Shewanella sairae]
MRKYLLPFVILSATACSSQPCEKTNIINDVVNVKSMPLSTKVFVQFDIGSSVLDKKDKAVLKSSAQLISALSDSSVLVIGHTDKVGDVTSNYRLSKQRAIVTAQYLIANGVDVNQVSINGIGYDNPISGENAKATERASEIIITGQHKPKPDSEYAISKNN